MMGLKPGTALDMFGGGEWSTWSVEGGAGDQNPNETPLKGAEGVLYSKIWHLNLSDIFSVGFHDMFSLYSCK